MVGKNGMKESPTELDNYFHAVIETYYIIILNLLGYNIDWFTLKEGLYIISNNAY